MIGAAPCQSMITPTTRGISRMKSTIDTITISRRSDSGRSAWRAAAGISVAITANDDEAGSV